MSTIDLRGVFYNSDLGFEERKEKIMNVIGESKAYNPMDFDLIHIGEDLIRSTNLASFDLAWGDFEDWAEKNNVKVVI